MAAKSVKVVLKCALMVNGVQCVMTTGMMMMQLWSVDSWDSLNKVYVYYNYRILS